MTSTTMTQTGRRINEKTSDWDEYLELCVASQYR